MIIFRGLEFAPPLPLWYLVSISPLLSLRGECVNTMAKGPVQSDELTQFPTPTTAGTGSADTSPAAPKGRGDIVPRFPRRLLPTGPNELGALPITPRSATEGLAITLDGAPWRLDRRQQRPSSVNLGIAARQEELLSAGSETLLARDVQSHLDTQDLCVPDLMQKTFHIRSHVDGDDGGVERDLEWRPLQLLGSGAFSRVLLCEANTAKPLLAAVKFVAFGESKKSQIRRAVECEVRMLQSISHRSIIGIYGVNIADTHATMLMDYVRGGTMLDLLRDARQRVRHTLLFNMFAQVTAAIAFLHDNSIVHRDVKLENILVSIAPQELVRLQDGMLSRLTVPYGLVVLCDFGLSRYIDPTAPLLETRCGSEEYAAPEILMGMEYDGRATDSWALGVVLYAMFHGYLPFDAEATSPKSSRRRKSAMGHLIARIEWSWDDEVDNGDVGREAKRITSLLLTRASKRKWASDLVKDDQISASLKLCEGT